MARISKRVREEAIEVADAMASDYAAELVDPVFESYRSSATDLAERACRAVTSTNRGPYPYGDVSITDELCFEWAEAAALLRGDDDYEPWNPGEPVRRLSKARP